MKQDSSTTQNIPSTHEDRFVVYYETITIAQITEFLLDIGILQNKDLLAISNAISKREAIKILKKAVRGAGALVYPTTVNG